MYRSIGILSNIATIFAIIVLINSGESEVFSPLSIRFRREDDTKIINSVFSRSIKGGIYDRGFFAQSPVAPEEEERLTKTQIDPVHGNTAKNLGCSSQYKYQHSSKNLCQSEGRSDSVQRRVAPRGVEEDARQKEAQVSNLVSSKGKGDGKGDQAVRLPPDIAKDVLVRAGRSLGKQQANAAKALKDVTKEAWKDVQESRGLEEKERYLVSEGSTRERQDVKIRLEEMKHKAIKYNQDYINAEQKLREKGEDIEHVGMVNKYMRQKMKENFPPMRNKYLRENRRHFNEQMQKEQMQKEQARKEQMQTRASKSTNDRDTFKGLKMGFFGGSRTGGRKTGGRAKVGGV